MRISKGGSSSAFLHCKRNGLNQSLELTVRNTHTHTHYFTNTNTHSCSFFPIFSFCLTSGGFFFICHTLCMVFNKNSCRQCFSAKIKVSGCFALKVFKARDSHGVIQFSALKSDYEIFVFAYLHKHQLN